MQRRFAGKRSGPCAASSLLPNFAVKSRSQTPQFFKSSSSARLSSGFAIYHILEKAGPALLFLSQLLQSSKGIKKCQSDSFSLQ
jgi:hypothetical protein